LGATQWAGTAHAGSFRGESVEVDAVPPYLLRQLVREQVKHTSTGAITRARADEESEREVLEKLVRLT
jgi:hypothetical protein